MNNDYLKNNLVVKTSQQDNQQGFIPDQHEIIHTEEVIIGTEQGTTFPTKIGTSVCNALIDTGATKSCISEKYYQQLPHMKMQKLNNIRCRFLILLN